MDGDGNLIVFNVYLLYNVMGFFCNVEGKFFMNCNEGVGIWVGFVFVQMLLKVGVNKIQVYWGIGYWGGVCGNVNVLGQIYNVGLKCIGLVWDNQCVLFEVRF